MKYLFRPLRLITCLSLGLLSTGAALAIEEDELLPVEEAYIPTVQVENDVATVSFVVAEGYYLYKERISFESARPEEVKVAALEMPEGEKKTDEFFGEQHVFHQNFSGTAKLSYPGAKPGVLAFRLKYQGCADVGVCYPPQIRTFAMDSGTRVVDSQLPSEVTAAPAPTETPADPSAAPAPTVAPGEMISGITDEASVVPQADPVAAAPAADPLGLSNPSPGAVLNPQDALPEDQAFRVQALATDGQTILVRVVSPPDYYLYRDKFSFNLAAEGVSATPDLPPGEPMRDEHFGEVQVFFGGVDIPLKLTRTRATPTSGTLAIEFQGCKKDSVCYPVMRRSFTIDLPTAAVVVSTLPETAGTSVSALPPSSPGKSTVVRAADAEVLPQILTQGIMLDAIKRAVNPAGAPVESKGAADVGLLLALLLALVGGVLLNLMPCVLPVLSLKVLSLVESGNSPKAARVQAIWYTAGVLSSFFLLGLILLGIKSAGSAVGWGFQLQNPLLVGGLAFLMIAMGLNLSGVFSFGHGFGNLGANLTQDSGARGAFFNGVLACIVATPCTGPGMFSALGYGFTQSNFVAMLVLLTLGLGLALPFLLIGFVPALARLLPRPGAWMEHLKSWLAFPLYLTAVWLIGVLGQQIGMEGMTFALGAAVVMAAGLWWWDRQRYSTRDNTWIGKLVAASLVVVSLAVLYQSSTMRPNTELALAKGQVAYNIDTLNQLRAEGKPVFVDMTAAWCITCKVNERNAINTYAVGQAMQEHGVVYMVGDYTNADPAIDAFLKAYGAVGVPLYVMFPASSKPAL